MSSVMEMSDENYFNGEWLREASLVESIMDTSCKLGNFLIFYQLNLKSDAPLEEEQVRCALNHLYRKAPNLGFCFGNRDGKKWLKRATNPNVDFKVLHGLGVEEVKHSLHTYRYPSETGPLFCVRLLQGSPDVVNDTDHLDPQLQHGCYLFFGFHHAIGDGTSNCCIIGMFITLLNDILSSKPVNETVKSDEERFGTFVSPDATTNLVMKKMAMIEADHDLQCKLGNEHDYNCKQKPLFINNFQGSGEAKTATINKILDQDTTLRFIQKCRLETVTVNSSLTALANSSIVDLLVEEGVIQDSYLIQNFHMISNRRYWETKVPKALGVHISPPLQAYTETPKSLDNTFWDYTRSLHKALKSGIESGKCLVDFAYSMMTSTDEPYSEEYLLSNKEYRGDFVTNNLGDVTPLVTAGGDHVKITHVYRASTLHLADSALSLGCHTFRGKLFFMLDYNTKAIKPEVVERFLSQILKRLHEVLQ